MGVSQTLKATPLHDKTGVWVWTLVCEVILLALTTTKEVSLGSHGGTWDLVAAASW